MRSIIVRILALSAVCLVLVGLLADPTIQADSSCEPDGFQPGGAVYRICMPAMDDWNGDLVVYAHGYVAFNQPIAIPEDQLTIPDGPSLPEIANGLGFAFAATSYRVNGLAVRPALEDLHELVDIFAATHGEPGYVYLIGPSEGGIITALAMEQSGDIYDGGLAVCGPVGSFEKQINYWGDVRVLFDFYFPEVLPGSPVDIPQEVIDNWETVYEPRLRAEFTDHSKRRDALLEAAQVPTNPTNSSDNIDALVDLLWYNVFATNDGIAKLGGQPFDNSHRLYQGPPGNLILNRNVARFEADPAALEEIDSYYQTSGRLQRPIVLLHTLGDPIIPSWHEPLYRQKVREEGYQTLHRGASVLRHYGHCYFTTAQLLFGFGLLVHQVSGAPLPEPERILKTPEQQQEYQALFEAYEASP